MTGLEILLLFAVSLGFLIVSDVIDWFAQTTNRHKHYRL